MDEKEPIELFEFDCPAEPLPEGATAAPRPAYRPRQIPADAAGTLSTSPVIDDELARFVTRLLDSSAAEKFREDRTNEMTFADACRFWSLDESTRGEQFDEALAFIIRNLIELNRTVTGTCVLPTTNRVLAVADIRMLLRLFFFLEERFDRHLRLLRKPSRNG